MAMKINRMNVRKSYKDELETSGTKAVMSSGKCEAIRSMTHNAMLKIQNLVYIHL